jgi:APA family basic amino acid/polyamine antiporter
MYKTIDMKTNMPTNSSVFGLLLCAIWLWYFYGANLIPKPWFGKFSFDSSELPIVTIYAMYIPIFIKMMGKEKELGFFKRYLAPLLAIVSCVFMIVAACYSHGMGVVYYLIVFSAIMVLGVFFMDNKV